jgi:hypothetical protein
MMLAGQMDLLGPGAIAADAAGAEATAAPAAVGSESQRLDGTVRFEIPGGLNAVSAAARRENVTIAEFLRRAVIARLELAANAATPNNEQVR